VALCKSLSAAAVPVAVVPAQSPPISDSRSADAQGLDFVTARCRKSQEQAPRSGLCLIKFDRLVCFVSAATFPIFARLVLPGGSRSVRVRPRQIDSCGYVLHS